MTRRPRHCPGDDLAGRFRGFVELPRRFLVVSMHRCAVRNILRNRDGHNATVEWPITRCTTFVGNAGPCHRITRFRVTSYARSRLRKETAR